MHQHPPRMFSVLNISFPPPKFGTLPLLLAKNVIYTLGNWVRCQKIQAREGCGSKHSISDHKNPCQDVQCSTWPLILDACRLPWLQEPKHKPHHFCHLCLPPPEFPHCSGKHFCLTPPHPVLPPASPPVCVFPSASLFKFKLQEYISFTLWLSFPSPKNWPTPTRWPGKPWKMADSIWGWGQIRWVCKSPQMVLIHGKLKNLRALTQGEVLQKKKKSG